MPSTQLSLAWALPFGGMLLSIALFPLISFRFWERHHGMISLGWALITALGLALTFGILTTKILILTTCFHHYFPFVIMIGTLYTIAGGIQIHLTAPATPITNTILLAFGSLLAGWIGTTGASMLLIRPFLQMNVHRKHRVHHMIFFIFLIGNIGGILTPLGDPPLFLGFLQGVSFFWPFQFLVVEMLMISLPLLLIFYAMDWFFMKKEGFSSQITRPALTIKGAFNGVLFLGVIALVLSSGLWKLTFHLSCLGVTLECQNMLRDGGLLLLAILSYRLTPRSLYESNHFSWGPLKEVAKLFFGIFITALPVITMLDAGDQGAFAPFLSHIIGEGKLQNDMIFWLSGGLSAFLDNAPTYLIFFHMTGGNASVLMTSLSDTLVALSLGSVFMGAMTYIGNAPNFMVKSIAETHKIPMPSFFGYMAWSFIILLPLLFILAWIRF